MEIRFFRFGTFRSRRKRPRSVGGVCGDVGYDNDNFCRFRFLVAAAAVRSYYTIITARLKYNCLYKKYAFARHIGRASDITRSLYRSLSLLVTRISLHHHMFTIDINK